MSKRVVDVTEHMMVLSNLCFFWKSKQLGGGARAVNVVQNMCVVEVCIGLNNFVRRQRCLNKKKKIVKKPLQR